MSEPHHMIALNRANEVRVARARLKEGISGGTYQIKDVLFSPPPYCRNMAIGELISSQRQWGSGRTEKFLEDVGISWNWRLGELSERQRRLLARML